MRRKYKTVEEVRYDLVIALFRWGKGMEDIADFLGICIEDVEEDIRAALSANE